jgi:hypothetical protein
VIANEFVCGGISIEEFQSSGATIVGGKRVIC